MLSFALALFVRCLNWSFLKLKWLITLVLTKEVLGLSDFFGPEILAKGDFFGSIKDSGILLGCEKKTEVFFWVAKKELRDFLGYAKNSNDFFG